MRLMQQISTSIQQNLFTFAVSKTSQKSTSELSCLRLHLFGSSLGFETISCVFIGHSDRPWRLKLKSFPAMFGCGQPLLINIEHEVIFCLSKQASQIQVWRGFIMNSALGTISSLCVCVYFMSLYFECLPAVFCKSVCALPLCASCWRLCLHEYVRGHLRFQCMYVKNAHNSP